jgi:hypothetical protein
MYCSVNFISIKTINYFMGEELYLQILKLKEQDIQIKNLNLKISKQINRTVETSRFPEMLFLSYSKNTIDNFTDKMLEKLKNLSDIHEMNLDVLYGRIPNIDKLFNSE